MDFSYGISVVMATYNTELSMLKEAVDSILDQTFKDFEFIIIDDGSDNGSDVYLRSVRDGRVKIIYNPHNIGITKSLNIGFKHAKGKYIARMDADDISVPTRFEKEYDYMERHPDVIVCGSETAGVIDHTIVIDSKREHRPDNMEEYRVKLLFKNPGPIHPTAMIRHEPLITHNIMYDERLIHAQDYGLWEDLSHYGKIHVLKDILLYRRKHENQISVAKREVQIDCDKMTQKKLLKALLGNVTDEEVNFHYVHSSGYFADAVISPEAADWYDRLVRENENRHVFHRKYLKKYIINAEKKLVIHSFRSDMTFGSKIKTIFKYIPLFPGLEMIVGHMIRLIMMKMRKAGKNKVITW